MLYRLKKSGIDIFKGPNSIGYAIPEVSVLRTDKECKIENPKWCRGYLLKKILSNLTIIDDEDIKNRREHLIKESIVRLDETKNFISDRLRNPGFDINMAKILISMPQYGIYNINNN